MICFLDLNGLFSTWISTAVPLHLGLLPLGWPNLAVKMPICLWYDSWLVMIFPIKTAMKTCICWIMILADLHVVPMKMAIYLLGYVMGMGQNWVLGCRLSSHHAKDTPCVAGAVTNTGHTTAEVTLRAVFFAMIHCGRRYLNNLKVTVW